MDIYSASGSRVKFTGKHGHDHELKEARKLLSTRRKYTVYWIDVSGWACLVFLREIPGVGFNTVMFINA